MVLVLFLVMTIKNCQLMIFMFCDCNYFSFHFRLYVKKVCNLLQIADNISVIMSRPAAASCRKVKTTVR